MVCFDRIGKQAAIWNCENCFAIFHIGCIKKWSKAGEEKDKKHQHQQQNLSISWACPACRSEVKGFAKSRCFCGKVAKPNFDPYLVPHSCGDPCHRPRTGTNCPHKCTQICHPGPCSACPALGKKKKCFCKKTFYQLRCGEEDEGKSCDNICDTLLNCKMHRCKEKCHSGECKPCSLSMERSCYCGKERKQLYCGEGKLSIVDDDIGYFSCEIICDKQLSCNNHQCKQICHPGKCKICVTDISIKNCPCGKVKLSKLTSNKRESCLDPVEVCHSVCEKLLPCSIHKCNDLCHIGPCKPCKETIKVTCRCGTTEQDVICSELYDKETNIPKEILCENICKKKRNCGRHTCNTICCPVAQIKSNSHPCTIICNKLLSCKIHKCKDFCHRGKCKPCLNASFDELCCTCGKTIIYPPVSCGTKPPVCSHPCNRIHYCDHEVLHSCHYDDECPKCYALVTKQCGCGKKLMTTKCYIDFPCCGDLCNKLLKCGKHSCKKPCHGGLCEDESIQPGESCGNRCNAEILTCSHKCSAPCHPKSLICPSIQCNEEVTLRCPCGNNTAVGVCLHGGNQADNPYNNDQYIRLECNDMCALKIRQKQLAVAFGRAEDLSDIIPTYPITLTNAAHSVPKFVLKIEQSFYSLIHSSLKTFQFPPMNSFYRSIIHQLAEFYKLDSVSYDQEPNRNVCVTKNLSFFCSLCYFN